MYKAILAFFIVLILSSGAYAQSLDPLKGTGQPLPRFVSLASDKVFVRSGPAMRYPILWIYQKEGLPVEIVQEFDTWRKVRDYNGDEGWIHQSLLRGRRSVLIEGDDLAELYNKPDMESGRVMARMEPNVIANLQMCDAGWCRVSADGYSGWIERNLLWGIYDGEQVD